MINYLYYRAYCFYKKNRIAIEPHTWAVVVPTFIVSFTLFFLYYILVLFEICINIPGSTFIYASVFLITDFFFDKIYKNKIQSFNKRWDNENEQARFIKGILIALLAILCLIGLFVIANNLHNLKKS
jgi:hypothetical protein